MRMGPPTPKTSVAEGAAVIVVGGKAGQRGDRALADASRMVAAIGLLPSPSATARPGVQLGIAAHGGGGGDGDGVIEGDVRSSGLARRASRSARMGGWVSSAGRVP